MIDIILSETDGVNLSTVNIAARQILRQHTDTATSAQIYYRLRDGNTLVTSLALKKDAGGMMTGIQESVYVLPPSINS